MSEERKEDIYKVEINGVRTTREFNARWHTSTYNKDKTKVRKKRRRKGSGESESVNEDKEFQQSKPSSSLGFVPMAFLIALTLVTLCGLGFIIKLILDNI